MPNRPIRNLLGIVAMTVALMVYPAAAAVYVFERAEAAHKACIAQRNQYDVIHSIIDKAFVDDGPTEREYFDLQGARPDCD